MIEDKQDIFTLDHDIPFNLKSSSFVFQFSTACFFVFFFFFCFLVSLFYILFLTYHILT